MKWHYKKNMLGTWTVFDEPRFESSHNQVGQCNKEEYARLLAAAPDLLYALEALREAAGDGKGLIRAEILADEAIAMTKGAP